MNAHPTPVLIVSYDWPPMVSGVRRMVKFARYLPEFGFSPEVVAARPTDFGPHDNAPLTDEVAHVPVHFANAFDPYHAVQWLRNWRCGFAGGRCGHSGHGGQVTASAGAGWLTRKAASLARAALLPDDRVGWVRNATRVAAQRIREGNIRHIITTSYPHSAHLVGLRLKRMFPHVRWVADFRDGWVQNPYFANAPTLLHRIYHRRAEAAVARAADAITTVCDPIAAHLAAVCGNVQKVHVIANGYDIHDTIDLPIPAPNTKFTIAYTGTLFMHRTPDTFFKALRRVIDETPQLAADIQVLFMSKFLPAHHAAVAQYGLQEVVREVPMGAHRDALALQHSADALLVLEGEAAHSEIMLTQKIFEYMAARRPVLAVAPAGALADAVRRSGCGIVVAPDDVVALAGALRTLLTNPAAYPYAPDENFIAQFDRRTLTEKLAQILKNSSTTE